MRKAILAIMLVLAAPAATRAQQSQPLTGLFSLPWVCGSKAGYEEFLALSAAPRSDRRDRRMSEMGYTQCHEVDLHSGYIVQRQQGRFAMIQLIEINVNRHPPQVSKGVWWARARDLEPYRVNL
jgi:hypothetical protein